MLIRKIPWRRVLVVCAALGAGALAGCELIVDFDRSKIDAGSVDSGGVFDVSVDQTVPVDGANDAPGDGTTIDAPPDADTDADAGTVDTGADTASPDTGADVEVDAPEDADDAG